LGQRENSWTDREPEKKMVKICVVTRLTVEDSTGRRLQGRNNEAKDNVVGLVIEEW